jgi:hypothetical protein
MRFDRDKFFDGYRSTFGSLDQGQVDGLNLLLDGYETYHGWWDNIDQISNSLSQVKHESAHSYQPVVEGFYFGDPNAPGYFQGNTERVRRFHRSLRYYPHIGRGHIQLTWLENHKEQDGLIRKYFPEVVSQFEARTGQTFDLVKHPDQALDAWISFCIMTIGMHKGTFREGHSLDRYINSKQVDHFGARNIVNGDRNYKNKQGQKIGDVIAKDAQRFKKILSAALVREDLSGVSEDEIDFEIPAAEPQQNPQNDPPASPALASQGEQAAMPPAEAQPTQQAENIVNVGGEPNVPANFVPEEKTLAAPEPSGILSRGWKWLLGLGLIPTTGSGLIESLKSYAADGTVNWRDVLAGSKEVLVFLMPYLIWVGIAFIAFWGIKELLKQVSFIVTQWTMARPDMHNVTVVPTAKPESQGRLVGLFK